MLFVIYLNFGNETIAANFERVDFQKKPVKKKDLLKEVLFKKKCILPFWQQNILTLVLKCSLSDIKLKVNEFYLC